MSGFTGLRVLALESRRAAELAKLISTYGGEPVVAPAMREVPLDSNTEALSFAEALLAGQFDIVIFLTGVGTRAVLSIAETKHPRDAFIAALRSVKVVPRGPKPIAVLRELGITPVLMVPEPNTWRELLEALDEAQKSLPEFHLAGARIALQEYGVSNPELIRGLIDRGAIVTRVPVYRWVLPEDVGSVEFPIVGITFSIGLCEGSAVSCTLETTSVYDMSVGVVRTSTVTISPST